MTISDAEFGRMLAAEWWPVYHWAKRHLVGTDPEDLTQHAMMQAWKNRETVKTHPKQNLRAYLLTIARNLRYSHNRHERILSIVSLDTDDLFHDVGDRRSRRVEVGIAISGGQEDTVRLRDAIHALSKLPSEQMTAVILAARGDTYEEAAAKSNVVVGTIKSRVARGRAALHEANV